MNNRTSFVDIHTHSNVDYPDIIHIRNIMYGMEEIPSHTDQRLYSLGIHPWHIKDGIEAINRDVFDHKNIIAIGEAGFDKVKGASAEMQEEIFRFQVRLSEQLSKPLIIHNVKSTNIILEINKEIKPVMPWILHGYRGNIQQTNQLLKHNFIFSFGEQIFQSERLKNIVRMIPIERIFIETDESSIGIEDLYSTLSYYIDINMEELRDQLYQNFCTLFPQQCDF